MADLNPTTPPPALPPVTPMTGDALILGLAALYRETHAAILAFDEAATHHPGDSKRHLESQKAGHESRLDAFENAILAIPADGLAGAMVQMEVLHLCDETEHHDPLVEAALWSVFGVLGRATNRTEADGILVMKPFRNVLRVDLANLMREWEQPRLDRQARHAGTEAAQ